METPDLKDFFSGLSDHVPFNDLSIALTASLLGPEISNDTAKRIINGAFDFEPKIVKAAPGISILELFHGPSCAFKDYGASFLASAMDQLLADRE